MGHTKEELLEEIEKLKYANLKLINSIKNKKYGLVWMDIKEGFENESENKLPVLKEVSELEIRNEDRKPTHILIEGDNYHALTCLSYTHREKVDVIYIDPPYNTGNDGFRYKDKRIMDKYPDGTEVPKDHPFRHSYWLSFMKKRLELSRDLLKDTGIIIISIDDNEFAQLKLLCDEVFSLSNKSKTLKDNFIGNIIRNTNSTKNQSNFLSITHDYTLVYAKNITILNEHLKNEDRKWEVPKNNVEEYKKQIRLLERKGLSREEITLELKQLTKYPRFFDFVNYWYVDDRGVYQKGDLGGVSNGHEVPLMNPLTNEYDPIPPGGFRYDSKTLQQLVKDDRIHFHTDGSLPRIKRYLDENPNQRPKGLMSDDQRPDNNLLQSMGLKFENPKQLAFMKRILSIFDKDAIILDFFAGSGTTAHATIELNSEDGGTRQAILVTDNEGDICREVCYPRVKNVINGWEDKRKNKTHRNKEYDGLGGSLKYYKTEFIGENNIKNINDNDRVKLALNAGELLAMAENTLYLEEESEYYQIFGDKQTLNSRHTAIYFREELDRFEEFMSKVEKVHDKGEVVVFIFSWGNDEFLDEFAHLENVVVKSIPQPILEIYRKIYNL